MYGSICTNPVRQLSAHVTPFPYAHSLPSSLTWDNVLEPQAAACWGFIPGGWLYFHLVQGSKRHFGLVPASACSTCHGEWVPVSKDLEFLFRVCRWHGGHFGINFLALLNIIFLLLIHFKCNLLSTFPLISYRSNIFIFLFLKEYIVAWDECRGDSLVLVLPRNIQDCHFVLRPKCPQSSNWHKTVVQDCSPRRAVHSLHVGFSLIRGRCCPKVMWVVPVDQVTQSQTRTL